MELLKLDKLYNRRGNGEDEDDEDEHMTQNNNTITGLDL
jgi:hypothetical protein